ncbi:hypothetical protein CRG98_014726 [Punica granatum]|nr:hypothetical protein CRG98_014726 [Punica granatum]
MSTKWRRIAAGGRKRISFPKTGGIDSGVEYLAEKGHFVAYSTDRKQFMIPLKYVNCNIFREHFKMSEEEFGLSSDDSVFMEYIVSLVRRGAAESLERALLDSISSTRQRSLSASSSQEPKSQHLLVSTY